jgi:hypothetical protein
MAASKVCSVYDNFHFDNGRVWSPEWERVCHLAKHNGVMAKDKCDIIDNDGTKFLKICSRDYKLVQAVGQARFVKTLGDSSGLKHVIQLRNEMTWPSRALTGLFGATVRAPPRKQRESANAIKVKRSTAFRYDVLDIQVANQCTMQPFTLEVCKPILPSDSLTIILTEDSVSNFVMYVRVCGVEDVPMKLRDSTLPRYIRQTNKDNREKKPYSAVVPGTTRSVVQCATMTQAHHVLQHGRPVTAPRGAKRVAPTSPAGDADVVDDYIDGAASECEDSAGSSGVAGSIVEATH